MQVSTDNDGRAVYMIARNGKAIVAPSRLGMMFTDAPKIERGLKIESVSHAKSDTSWTQPWGEWRTIRDNHREMRVRLMESSALHRRYDVVFRVQDDGVGFRYEFPEQQALPRRTSPRS
ncbi:Glycoside hydrolase 97 [Sphingomonas paucimobilis]|nr:Glycoside hydrolase 97 [Sphingomonas paucimobilis]